MKHKYHPFKHHRRTIRLKGWDYASSGVYFVTILVKVSDVLFGDISNRAMDFNEIGQVAVECWKAIPVHFPGVNIDEYVVMPNHIHGIIVIVDQSKIETVGAPPASPLKKGKDGPRGPYPGSLGANIG